MSRSVKMRHKPINGICYVYKVVSEETYQGRCKDPEHNPPKPEPRAGIHLPLSPRERKRKR